MASPGGRENFEEKEILKPPFKSDGNSGIRGGEMFVFIPYTLLPFESSKIDKKVQRRGGGERGSGSRLGVKRVKSRLMWYVWFPRKKLGGKKGIKKKEDKGRGEVLQWMEKLRLGRGKGASEGGRGEGNE